MKTTPIRHLRHFSRIPFDAQVLMHLHDRTISVHLIDIAFKGALVQTTTSQALAVQEKCRLVLPLAEDGETITMAGRIVHLEQRLVGIECLEIDVASLTELRRLMMLNSGDAQRMNRELSHMFTGR